MIGLKNRPLLAWRRCFAAPISPIKLGVSRTLVSAAGPGPKGPVTIDRELPDPFAFRRQNRNYFWAYGIGVTLACAIVFNYEKTTSPIINSTLYFLRRSVIARDTLGSDINFASSWPWIRGPLNTVKGDIDIKFDVTGSKGTGTLKLKATRVSKLHPFDVHHFLLSFGDDVFDLTKDPEMAFDL